MPAPPAQSLRWTLTAALVGGAGAYVFSSVLQWPRDQFIAAHVVLVGLLVLLYGRVESVHIGKQFARRWKAGLIGGAAVGGLLARQVWSQAASAVPQGVALAWALVWNALVYGTADAMLLTVLPVLTVYGSRPAAELATTKGRLRVGAEALVASAVVTAAYHLGFSEYRGAALVAPIIGNSIITVAYLLTGSPVTAVAAHVMMHAAAVLHGMDTTIQLPPHY